MRRLFFLYPRIGRSCYTGQLKRGYSSKTAPSTSQADFHGRLEALQNSSSPMYPLIQDDSRARQISQVRKQYDGMTSEQLQALSGSQSITVRGRVTSVRASGKKLVFVDIEQDENKIQGIYRRDDVSDLESDQFAQSWQWLRRGDFICMYLSFISSILSRSFFADHV